MNVLSLAKLFDRSLKVTQNRWTDKRMAKENDEQFQAWKITTLQPFLQTWREYMHPKLIGFVLPAVEYCRSRRIAAGKLNFQDLLMKAVELLRSYPEVRAYFGRRYSHLFVDEFQDTDPIQAEMMMLLTGTDPEEYNWRKQLPRSGSLFIVGDPKQSIYRFRRADISTYNLVKQRIEKCGAVLQLTRNFRSVKAIGDYVNYAFEYRFIPPGKLSDIQAPFVRMIIVMLACPCGEKDHNATEHINRMVEPPVGFFTISKPKGDYHTEIIAQPVGWAALSEKERKYMNAEQERLLYVATTRAKQLLIVSQYPSRPLIDPWSKLAVSLQQQPELLNVVSVDLVKRERMETPHDLEPNLAEWVARLELASKPSYRNANVTGLTKTKSDITLVRSSDGKGMAYGNLVHRYLQAIGEGLVQTDLADYCQMTAEEEDVDSKWVQQAIETVLQLIEGELWKRSMQARQRYHEFSFVLSRELSGEDGEDLILRGVIDLVFEEEDGWVIVDFKTDRYETEHEEQFVEYYKLQVMAYVDEWERTVGGCVKEAGLYFIDKHRYVKFSRE